MQCAIACLMPCGTTAGCICRLRQKEHEVQHLRRLVSASSSPRIASASARVCSSSDSSEGDGGAGEVFTSLRQHAVRPGASCSGHVCITTLHCALVATICSRSRFLCRSVIMREAQHPQPTSTRSQRIIISQPNQQATAACHLAASRRPRWQGGWAGSFSKRQQQPCYCCFACKAAPTECEK